MNYGFYQYINKEIGKGTTCRHMSITEVRQQYIRFLGRQPIKKLEDELMKMTYRPDYSDKINTYIINLMMQIVTFITAIIGFFTPLMNGTEIMQTAKTATFVFMLFIVFAFGSLVIQSVTSMVEKRRKMFDCFKRDCLEEAISKKKRREKFRKHRINLK